MTHLRNLQLASVVVFLQGCGGSVSDGGNNVFHDSAAGGGARGTSEPHTDGAANFRVAGSGGTAGRGVSTLVGGVHGGTEASTLAGSAGTNQPNGGTSFDTSSNGPDQAGGGVTTSIAGGGGLVTSAGQSGTVGGVTAGIAGSVGTSSAGIGQAAGELLSGGTSTLGGAAGRGGVGGISDSSSGGSTYNQGGATSPGGSGTGGILGNCIIAGVGYRGDLVNPADPCQSCQPAVSTSTWSPMAEGASCGSKSYCQSGACVVGCMIASTFYANGTINPASACETCDTGKLKTTWSKVAGKSCGPELVAGADHTCALVDGGVWCWGVNVNGQLGIGSTAQHSTIPVPVPGLGTGVAAIVAGSYETCAIVNGAAMCWGIDPVLTQSLASPVVPTPTQVPGLERGVTAISIGESHACAIVEGAAKCWGSTRSGRLGNGANASPYADLVQVSGLTSNITAIAAGVDHSCAATDDGHAHCWGENLYGQLGNDSATGSLTPVTVKYIGNVTVITAGESHSCAISGGGAFCWGANTYGQLGGEGTNYGSSKRPVQVVGMEAGVTAISSQSNHSCAINNDVAKCWGLNDYGQLGNANAPYPSRVPVGSYGLSSTTATSVAVGESHSCFAIGGVVYCTGENTGGKLGDGTTTDNTVPVRVKFP